jgi:hypothetical protein
MTSALLLSYFGLVAFDVWATIKLLTKLGVDAELNDAVKWAIKKLGLARGVSLGVILPASAWGIGLSGTFPYYLQYWLVGDVMSPSINFTLFGRYEVPLPCPQAP